MVRRYRGSKDAKPNPGCQSDTHLKVLRLANALPGMLPSHLDPGSLIALKSPVPSTWMARCREIGDLECVTERWQEVCVPAG